MKTAGLLRNCSVSGTTKIVAGATRELNHDYSRCTTHTNASIFFASVFHVGTKNHDPLCSCLYPRLNPVFFGRTVRLDVSAEQPGCGGPEEGAIRRRSAVQNERGERPTESRISTCTSSSLASPACFSSGAKLSRQGFNSCRRQH